MRSPVTASRGPTTADRPPPAELRRPAVELPPLVVIGGATASGKTELGIALAQRLPGAEIVSADSRQIYRGLDIATAKPTLAQQAAVPHHGLDLVEPDEPFTAADYRRAALRALRGIARRGGLALLVGGTGLYLRTIARGLRLDRGDYDDAVRATLEERLRRDGLAVLVDELERRDAQGAAGIDRRNPRRVVRALERAVVTGSAAPPPPAGYPAPVTWLGLEVEPAEHRRRIRQRVEQHFGAGLLDEAAGLLERYPPELRAFSAMGYREAFDVLAGRATVGAAQATDARRTWAYARRQRTWFRSEPDIAWLAAGPGVVDAAWHVLAPWFRDIGRADYAGAR